MVIAFCGCRNPEWLIEQVKNLLGFTPVGFSINPSVWSQHLLQTHQSPGKVLDILEKCSDVESPNDPLKVKQRGRRKSSERKHVDSRMFTEQRKLSDSKRRRRSRDEAPHSSMSPPMSASHSQTSVMPPSYQLECKLQDAGQQKSHNEKVRTYRVIENSALSNEGGTRSVEGSLFKMAQRCDKEDAKLPGRLVLRIKRINTPLKCTGESGSVFSMSIGILTIIPY